MSNQCFEVMLFNHPDSPYASRYNALVKLMEETGEQVKEKLEVIRKLETPPTYKDIIKYKAMEHDSLRNHMKNTSQVRRN